MAKLEEQLERWIIASPQSIVRILAEHRRRRTPELPVPVVTLHADGGFSHVGQVLGVEEEPGSQEELVVLRCGEPPGRADLLVLPLTAVRAVRIHDVATVAPLFTGERWPAAPGAVELSPLQLKRWMAEQEQGLADHGIPLRLTVAWESLPASAGIHAEVRSYLAEMVAQLVEAGRDQAGVKALAAWERLELVHTDVGQPALRADGRRLVLRVNLDRARPHELAGELGRQLDGLL